MRAEIVRHALDRVPLSLIIDDSTVLVNLNYFWMRDRNLVDGENRRWEDVPVVHPESFTRRFAEFCLDEGVRGKFSVVPCPAALGRIDEGLPIFSRQQTDSWLAMCRELITPNFDITPQMIPHTVGVDPHTMVPVEPQIWEQYDWQALPEQEEERVVDYMATACRILVNVGFEVAGVTSPGGYGGQTLPFYARTVGEAVRQATGHDVPFFFKRVEAAAAAVDVPVWYPDPAAGTAVGEIIASTGDWTGSWTGYGEIDADRYITGDLQGGRLAELIDAGQPAVLVSHWQGFYGLHDGDQRGFSAFRKVVRRLRERDPHGEWTRWRRCSEITRYACAREMAAMEVGENRIDLSLPVRVPELTLRVFGVEVTDIRVDGAPLRRAAARSSFESGTYLPEGDALLVAFDPTGSRCTIELGISS